MIKTKDIVSPVAVGVTPVTGVASKATCIIQGELKNKNIFISACASTRLEDVGRMRDHCLGHELRGGVRDRMLLLQVRWTVFC